MHDLKASEYDPLDSIIEEFTARVRGGERPTVEEYVGRYPESAERIRELFPALAEIEHVGFTLGHVEESKKTVTRIGSIPSSGKSVAAEWAWCTRPFKSHWVGTWRSKF